MFTTCIHNLAQLTRMQPCCAFLDTFSHRDLHVKSYGRSSTQSAFFLHSSQIKYILGTKMSFKKKIAGHRLEEGEKRIYRYKDIKQKNEKGLNGTGRG